MVVLALLTDVMYLAFLMQCITLSLLKPFLQLFLEEIYKNRKIDLLTSLHLNHQVFPIKFYAFCKEDNIWRNAIDIQLISF